MKMLIIALIGFVAAQATVLLLYRFGLPSEAFIYVVF